MRSVECEGRVCEFVCSSVGRGGKAGSRPDYDDRDVVEQADPCELSDRFLVFGLRMGREGGTDVRGMGTHDVTHEEENAEVVGQTQSLDALVNVLGVETMVSQTAIPET